MSNASFTIRLYGEVNEQPPYLPNSVGNLPAVSATYDTSARIASNFPSANVIVYPIAAPGSVMGGNVSCYGVIEVPPSGNQLYGKKFVVQETVAQIATLRNT
jgi:hypothetical protein